MTTAPFRFVLFYQPPCGDWYVHSHKLYPSEEAARAAARKFLPVGTVIAIASVGSLDRLQETVQ